MKVSELISHYEFIGLIIDIKPVSWFSIPPCGEEEFKDILKEHNLVFVKASFKESDVNDREIIKDRLIYYVSKKLSLAERFKELDERFWTPSDSNEDINRVIREIGSLLGYPECCTKSYYLKPSFSSNIDGEVINRMYQLKTGEKIPFYLNNFNFAYYLTNFFPCSYNCENAKQFSKKILEYKLSIGGLSSDFIDVLKSPILFFSPNEVIYFDNTKRQGDLIYYTHPHQKTIIEPTEATSKFYNHMTSSLEKGDAFLLKNGRIDRIIKDGKPIFKMKLRNDLEGHFIEFE